MAAVAIRTSCSHSVEVVTIAGSTVVAEADDPRQTLTRLVAGTAIRRHRRYPERTATAELQATLQPCWRWLPKAELPE